MIRTETVLQRLADGHSPSEERRSLHISEQDSPWTATLTVDRCDAVGCLMWQAALHSSVPVAGGLSDWAHQVASRVQALRDCMSVVEVDAVRGAALLRSESPTVRGEKLLYYEMLLTGNSDMELRRFEGSHQAGQRREQRAFALTHESVAQLLSELTAA